MRRPIFTHKPSVPRQHEWSVYHTQRDNYSPLKHWKASTAYANQINHFTQLVEEVARALPHTKQQTIPSFGFFPFRIYILPTLFRPQTVTGSYNPVNNWRTVKVRNGNVLTKYATTGSFDNSSVFGTDGVQYVDNDILPNPVETGDILVPTGSNQYYIWVEALDTPIAMTGSYVIQSGNDPKTVGIQNKWTTFPTASSNHFPIGYVDSKSSASIFQLLIRQFQRTDITSTSADNYITMSICQGQQEVVYFVDAHKSGSS